MASEEEQTTSGFDGHIGSELNEMSRKANTITQSEMVSSVGVDGDGDTHSLQPQESKQIERNPKGASGLGKKFAVGIAFSLFFLLVARASMLWKLSPTLIPKVEKPLPSKDIPIEPVEPQGEDKRGTEASGGGDGEEEETPQEVPTPEGIAVSGEGEGEEEEAPQEVPTPEGPTVSGEGEGEEEEAPQEVPTPEGTAVSGEGEGKEEETPQEVPTPEGTAVSGEGEGEEEEAPQEVPTPEGTGEGLEEGLPSEEVVPQEPVPLEEPSPEEEEPLSEASDEEEGVPTTPIDGGYKAPSCLSEDLAMFMFERLVVFEGAMQIRKPISKGEGQQATHYVTFLISAEPAVQMSAAAVVESGEEEFRMELVGSLVQPVESAMETLLREEVLDPSVNPIIQYSSPGYGTIRVQRVQDKQYSAIHDVRESDRERPSRPLRTEMTIDSSERAAEEIEAVLQTGRGVIVLHYPRVDIVACICQPTQAGDAIQILGPEFPNIDDFRMDLEELINVGVNEDPDDLPVAATLRLTPGPGVPTTTFISVYFIPNDPRPDS